jgi:hypothetical protein
VGWRVLGELERNPGSIRPLQRINKTPVPISEVLVDDFEFAFELDRLPLPRSQLSRDSVIVSKIVGRGVVREKRRAAKKNDGCNNRICYEDITSEDPGADL